MSTSFRPYERIKYHHDFTRVYQQGKKIVSSSCVIYIDIPDRTRQYSRLGIVASKRIGNAVNRNYCKRLVREVFRRNKERFPPGSDVIVVVKRDMVGKCYAALEEEFYSIVER